MSKGILHVTATFTVHTPDLDDDRAEVEAAIRRMLKFVAAKDITLKVTQTVLPGESA